MNPRETKSKLWYVGQLDCFAYECAVQLHKRLFTYVFGSFALLHAK